MSNQPPLNAYQPVPAVPSQPSSTSIGRIIGNVVIVIMVVVLSVIMAVMYDIAQQQKAKRNAPRSTWQLNMPGARAKGGPSQDYPPLERAKFGPIRSEGVQLIEPRELPMRSEGLTRCY